MLRWMATTLVGHMVYYAFLMTLTVTPVMLYLDYSEGYLTASWAVFVCFIGILVGAFAGIFCWYTIQQPLLKRKEGRY